jgi:hypothetical protein
MKLPITAAGAVAAACVTAYALPIHRTPAPPVPNWAKDVAPIVYKRCSGCHHAGEVAPFTLTSYADAKKRARQLADITERRIMPPWKAEGHGEFRNENRLTDAEIATIKQWAEHGTPMGDPRKAPPAPTFTAGWKQGKPDRIISLPKPFELAAEGDDVYRCFVIPAGVDADRWIKGMEFRPGNRKVVHHIIAYLDTTGQARKLDAQDPGDGYSSSGGGPGIIPSAILGGWAPGNENDFAPEGYGVLLPKNSDIVLEVHYHKSGKPETDQSSVGIHYQNGPVAKRFRSIVAINTSFLLKPDIADQEVKATTLITKDATAWAVTPHMHLLGRKMTVTAEFPNGSRRTLVSVPDWDFNWQMSYAFREPIKLPAGTKIHLTARYDNSSGNPNNPSRPPKPVRWGEQTTDEMCIAFLAVTSDEEDLTQGRPGGRVSLFEIGNVGF